MNAGKSHYDVLGVAPALLRLEIKAAYQEKLLAAHPDKGGAGHAAGMSIARLKEAFRVLHDPQSRAEYDEALKEDSKKSGFVVTGAGLDSYTLLTFEEIEDGGYIWVRDCPRCSAEKLMQLTEDDLENGTPDGAGGYSLVVSCGSCSLWITVTYAEVEEGDG